MHRTAIVTPSSLGAIEAYRMVIKDISDVLGDPVIDIARLFFAVMIQSGLEQFVLPDKHPAELVRSSLLDQRITTADYAKVEPVIRGIDELIGLGKKDLTLSKEDEHVLYNLIAFLHDLYIAAEFKRPVATVTDRPEPEAVRRLLREDVAVVVDGLLRCVQTVDVEAPVAKMEVVDTDLKMFRRIVESDAFGPYVDSQRLFETASHSAMSVSHEVVVEARALVRRFPSLVDLRRTAVRAIDVVPEIVEVAVGKALGALAKPFTAALSGALGREQRLLLYSFYPTWRRIWDGKLDKVRFLIQQERAARPNKPLQPTSGAIEDS
jgi:hypothetical protein